MWVACKAVTVVALLACGAGSSGTVHAGIPSDVDLADRVLNAARDTAARHPGTQAAQWQAQAARHELAVAQRRQLPRPSVALTAQSQGGVGTEARLTQTLYDWGGTQARIDAADGRVSAAAQGVREQERGVMLDVIDAWRAWATAGLHARSQAAGLSRLTDCELGARRRADAGLGSLADLALVASRLAQARSELHATQSARASAAARLRGLGAVAVPEPWQADASSVAPKAADATLPAAGSSAYPVEAAPCHAPDDEAEPLVAGPVAAGSATVDGGATRSAALQLGLLVAHAVERSAALARLRAEAESADASARAARAERFPVINAVALHQRNDASAASGSASRLLLTLEYAPSSWGGGADTLQAALARAAAVRAELDAARQALVSGLEAEHALLTGLVERGPSEQAAVASAQAVLRSFARQFRSGRKTWLDVLNAARELAAAEQAADALRVDLVASRARLAVLADLRSAAQAAAW
jgi:outer membrane protein, adhesin transport system